MQTLPPVDCWKAFKLGFQNFAKFTGRSRRSEYFYFQISLGLIEYFVYCAFSYPFEEETINGEYELNEDGKKLIWIPLLMILVCLVPQIAITVRRLHDIGRSGFYCLLGLIPFFGSIIIFILCCIDSQRETNEYGPSPKYVMPPQDNNYNPPIPGVPVNPYPQPNNVVAIPISPYQQPNPIPPEVMPLPQPNSIPPEVMNNPQSNYINPQNTPYSQVNPIPPPPEGVPYPSLDDPYSKPSPIQPPVPPYSEQNNMQFSGDIYSQQNPNQPSGDIYSQPNPNQPSGDIFSQQNPNQPSGDIYSQQNPNQPSGNIYSQPNPMQPASGNYYNPNDFNGQ